MKKKLLASVLLAASLVTLGAVSAARAEPLPTATTSLETVDEVTVLPTSGSQSVMKVTGIVVGDTQPREFDLNFSGTSTDPAVERCFKMFLLSQSHPGRYVVAISGHPTHANGNVSSCKLKSR